MSEKPKVLLIGYGNTLRGDDAVGPRAAAIVQGWGLAHVSALAVTQLTPELAEPLAAVPLAIFVDARLMREQDSADAEVLKLDPLSEPSALGHTSSPRDLLALALAAYGTCPKAWLVTVPSSNFSLREARLSPRAHRGLEDALKLIAALLSPVV